MARTCPNGHVVTEEGSFCTECGARLDAAEPSPDAAVPPAPSAPLRPSRPQPRRPQAPHDSDDAWRADAIEKLRASSGDWSEIDPGENAGRAGWILDEMADDLAIVCGARDRWSLAEGATSWSYADGVGEITIGADPDAAGNLKVVAWYFASVSVPGEDSRRARFARSDDAVAFVERYAP